MNKIINNILEEWAYRVHDGMPNPKNPLHLVHLEDTLNELSLPKEVSIKLLQNLRKIKEADAEVMGATVAQARDKAKDGQTYSSKRAKKVYQKGKDDIGGKDDVSNTQQSKTKKEIPNPEYLEKFSDTASKVMSEGGAAVLEAADEITQSAIDMSAGGVGGPAPFFGESQTTDLINKIGSGREKRSKEDFINDMVNYPPPKGYKGTPIYEKIGEESMRKWLNSSYDGAISEINDLKNDPDTKFGKQKEPYPIAMTVNDKGMSAARSLIQKKMQEAKTPEDKAHYENELKIYNELVEKAAYKDGGSDGDADTLMFYTDTDGMTRLRAISNKQTINDIQLNSAATSRSATMESVASPEVANNMKGVLNEAIDNSSKLNTGFTGNVRNDIDEMGITSDDIPNSVFESFTGRDSFKVTDKYLKNATKNPLVKEYLEKNPDASVGEAVMAVVGNEGASSVSGTSKTGAPGKAMIKVFETTRDIRSKMDARIAKGMTPEEAAADVAGLKHKNGNPYKGGKISAEDMVAIYNNDKLKSLEKRHIERNDHLAKQHRTIVSKTQELDEKEGYDIDGENGPHQQAYIASFIKEMHWESYVANLDGRKSINMGGKTYRPAHFRQALSELSGFEGDINTPEGRKELQEHLEKNVKMVPGSGEVYIASKSDDPDAVDICIKKDDGGQCEKSIKGHMLASDSWRTAGDGGKVDGSFGKAMKTKLQEVRER